VLLFGSQVSGEDAGGAADGSAEVMEHRPAVRPIRRRRRSGDRFLPVSMPARITAVLVRVSEDGV
jgi:hypothetical protein